MAFFDSQLAVGHISKNFYFCSGFPNQRQALVIFVKLQIITKMATKNKKSATAASKLTFEQDQQTEQHLQPFCENAAAAAYWKNKAEELRPLASAELQAKLDADPETKDFKGTVVYLCGDQIYKIRVQRRANCDWRSKRLNDPNLKEYKALMRELDEKKKRQSELEDLLAEAHPKCVERSFIIAFLK